MKIEYIPGWLLILALSLLAMWLSGFVSVGGKHPLEASALVIILGIIVRNFYKIPPKFNAGIKASEKLLILGIVLMGASLDHRTMLGEGWNILAIILVTMLVSFAVIYFLGKIFTLPSNLSLLLAVGTTICGGTAIAITAPLIKAKEEETSYAVATIALWGVAAIFIYPSVAQMLGVSDFSFGVFAGTAVHSTPQVIGAGMIFSAAAGKTASAIKLIRNCFMAPLAFAVACLYTGKDSTGAPSSKTFADFSRAFPWFLFGYFIMSWCNTKGYFSASGIEAFSNSGRFLIVLGMAGVGLNTAFDSFRKVGVKPLLVGLLGALVVAASSIAMITILL